MDEAKARKLARFRVGEERFMGKNMDSEEIKLRQEYMRNILRGIEPWKNLTAEQMENVRIYKIRDDWYIEDQDFYEYNF